MWNRSYIESTTDPSNLSINVHEVHIQPEIRICNVMTLDALGRPEAHASYNVQRHFVDSRGQSASR